jgi:hypothetical protein
MLKHMKQINLLVSLFFLSTTVVLQADFSAFMAGLRVLLAAPQSCGCGEKNKSKLIKLTCCNTIVCDSCLDSRRDNAIREHKSMICKACGKTLENLNIENQAEVLQAVAQKNAAVSMCVSKCNSRSELTLSCGHKICRSCLRSAVVSAQIKSQQEGFEAVVFCPSCKHVLSLQDISKAY